MGSAPETSPPSKIFSLLPIIISSIFLTISLIGFLLTFHVYSLTQRPYVGIVSTNFLTEGNPPTRMKWTFVLKNVGSLPALINHKEFQATLTTDGRTIKLPTYEISGVTDVGLLMPQQEGHLHGEIYNEAGDTKVNDVLSGGTKLDLSIDLSYEPTAKGFFGSLWSKVYTYRIRSQFRPTFTPGFVMLAPANAD